MAVSDQMEMALSESGRQDPVSGNDVPMGSLPEEVRDDVPAMLSEGEYVVPADVLRFYGLKFFEDLRTDAKVQIAQMADEGRIGGEPIAGPGSAAPTPDQPNGLDLSPEDMQKLESVLQASEGGAVGFQEGGLSDVLKENEEGGLPTKKVGMDVDKDTDMLIDRIMNSVQKNPMIKEKLAARGIGFMNGGDVKGYAPGGAVDYINVAKNYKPSFDPFNPDFGLGMYSSSLMKPKEAADIQEEAGVAAPTKAVKKKKVEEGEDPNNPSGVQGKSLSDKTDAELSKDIADMQSMQNQKGFMGMFANSIFGKSMISSNQNELSSRESQSDKRSGGGTGSGSTSGGGEGPGNVSSDGTAGGTSSAATSGAGGSGAVDPDATPGVMNQGGFISRRKKT